MIGKETIQALNSLGRLNNFTTYIETGCAGGESMSRIVANRKIGIEVDYMMCFQCHERIKDALIIHGDSALVLERVIINAEEPFFIYLDAHKDQEKNAGSYPLINEIDALSAYGRYINTILIDDVRLFERYQITTREIMNKLGPGYAYELIDSADFKEDMLLCYQ